MRTPKGSRAGRNFRKEIVRWESDRSLEPNMEKDLNSLRGFNTFLVAAPFWGPSTYPHPNLMKLEPLVLVCLDSIRIKFMTTKVVLAKY